MFLCRLGHRKRFSFCVCSSRSARTAGIRCPMNCLTRPRRLFFSTTFAADKLNFCLLPFPFVSLGRAALRSHGMGRVYPRHHHQHSPLVGLEATSKMQKGRNLGHNIAKITKISPFSAVTFFIYQNFPETNCENDFFITFTDFFVKTAILVMFY